MATRVPVGRRMEEIELLDLFHSDEGTIDQIYGRVGNGKTYAATADILRRLVRGEVVYANWIIDFTGYDERTDFFAIFAGVLGFKRKYYRFNPENLRFISLDDDFIDNFEKLTDCAVYLDEGHVVFDSYQHAKFSLRKRKAILHTRHFNRSIIIISQRPTAVHVSARANVNRFFKVERWLRWPFLVFTKTEYQDMLNETVDETKPIRTKMYFGKRAILNAYNSKYMRAGIPNSQEVNFEGYNVGWLRSWQLLFYFFLPKFIPAEPEEALASSGARASSFPIPLSSPVIASQTDSSSEEEEDSDDDDSPAPEPVLKVPEYMPMSQHIADLRSKRST